MQNVEECDHARRIDDDHTATEVCTQCGLVLDTIVFPQCFQIDSYCPSEESLGTQNFKKIDKDRRLRTQLRDICAYLHADGPHFQKQVFSYFRKLRKHATAKRKNETSLLAYAVLESFNVNLAPRPPEEVAYAAGINKAEILEVEKALNISLTYCETEFYVYRICDSLYFPTFITEGVRSAVSKLTDIGSFKPESIVAATILLFLEKIKNERGVSLFPKITVKYLCTLLVVSSASICKIKRAIDPGTISDAFYRYAPQDEGPRK